MDKIFDLNLVRWTVDKRGLPEAYYKIKTPSVSAILNLIPDPELEIWVQKVGKAVADEIMTQASYRGTALHTFIEQFIGTYSKTKDASEALRMTQTQSPQILQKQNIPINKIDEGRDLFYKFYYSEFPTKYSETIAMELGLYSPSLFYRGKLDVFFKERIFGLAITDFKTSNGYIKKENRDQAP